MLQLRILLKFVLVFSNQQQEGTEELYCHWTGQMSCVPDHQQQNWFLAEVN